MISGIRVHTFGSSKPLAAYHNDCSLSMDQARHAPCLWAEAKQEKTTARLSQPQKASHGSIRC